MDVRVKSLSPDRGGGASLDAEDLALVTAIAGGLPLVPQPYEAIGRPLGMDEEEVIIRLRNMLSQGVIKRLGVVVRHRELGYGANAMVVWDVPDEQVTTLGPCIGRFEFVTLCYRRPRRLPDWPYNLFCMIHGRSREAVIDSVRLLVERCGLADLRHEVLFSQRRFKQRGAIYHGASSRPEAGA